MHDNEPQGNELLIYAGVGVYVLAVVLQMFSFWANAYVWSWMTLKYLALLALAALPIVMFEGRARMGRVLGAFYAVLALTAGLTYSDGSVDYHASGKKRALELSIEQAEKDWDAKNTSQYRDFKYYDDLYAVFFNEATAARENMGAKDWEAKEKDLKAKREAREKAYKERLKSYQTYGAAEDLVDLRHELAFDHTEARIGARRESLRSAKALDFFILLGAALFVAGCLMPGAPAVPPYTPPASK